MITFGSLFAGIGGFDLGFERAGMVPKWQVEIDPWCRRVLAKHWPHVERKADIRECSGHNLRTPDVLCGGFPCQDVSHSGKRDGINGARSGLWFEYSRIIRELQPRYVVIENVPGLLVRGFDAVLGELAQSGYDAEWDCFPASAFGCYHERDRLFIVAYSASLHRDSRYLLGAGQDWRAQAKFGRLRRMVDATERRERNTRFELEPRLDRLVDGVPDRSHRLGALGNSIVPQVAEFIGRQIVRDVGGV